MWRKYYEKWPQVTLEREGAALVELHPALAELVPPAQVLDKHVYSPWTEGGMDRLLGGTGIDTLIVTGGETSTCGARPSPGAIGAKSPTSSRGRASGSARRGTGPGGLACGIRVISVGPSP